MGTLMNSSADEPAKDPQSAPGPLDGVTVSGDGSLVFSGDGPGETSQDEQSRDRFQAVVEKLVTDDRFSGFVRWFYSWIGNRLKVNSLEISPDDKDFRQATDLLYGDLKDGFLGPFVDHASSETLERVLVYGAGFGLPLVGAYREVQARKGDHGEDGGEFKINDKEKANSDEQT